MKDITYASGSLNIVRAVAAMAKGLGMQTTAEGVETQEQLEAVKAEGCTEMQGFLLSRRRAGRRDRRAAAGSRRHPPRRRTGCGVKGRHFLPAPP